MAKLPKLAARTIELNGRPGKTITQAGRDRSGYQGRKYKEHLQP
jgi:hypothetical protein